MSASSLQDPTENSYNTRYVSGTHHDLHQVFKSTVKKLKISGQKILWNVIKRHLKIMIHITVFKWLRLMSASSLQEDLTEKTYSWVPNRRVYSFIWHQRNMKKETDTKTDKSI